MKSIIKQIYNGDLCISERTTTCVSEFRTARDIAVQAHDSFEDKLCQPMKQELDEYLSKESDVTSYLYRASLCRWLQGWRTDDDGNIGGG